MDIGTYKITEVRFSHRDDVVAGNGGAYSRVSTLVAHVVYEYIGFNNTKEYGSSVVDIITLSTLSFNESGEATDLITTDVSESQLETIKGQIDDAIAEKVEADIQTVIYEAQERSYLNRSLGVISSNFDINERYSPTGLSLFDNASDE